MPVGIETVLVVEIASRIVSVASSSGNLHPQDFLFPHCNKLDEVVTVSMPRSAVARELSASYCSSMLVCLLCHPMASLYQLMMYYWVKPIPSMAGTIYWALVQMFENSTVMDLKRSCVGQIDTFR